MSLSNNPAFHLRLSAPICHENASAFFFKVKGAL
jgi:hypothetical protein